jgi:hypothetical protein
LVTVVSRASRIPASYCEEERQNSPQLRLHFDAPLLRDDLEDAALLLDPFLELGVVSTVGLLEKLRRGCSVIAEDTERLRENEEA